jgi:hypothetical protein
MLCFRAERLIGTLLGFAVAALTTACPAPAQIADVDGPVGITRLPLPTVTLKPQPSQTLTHVKINNSTVLAGLALGVPLNVRSTQSLSECKTYAAGGPAAANTPNLAAGIACAAAMQNRWYILIWDWTSGAVDGFKVYQTGNAASALSDRKMIQVSEGPIQTISQQGQVRVAFFDPSKVGSWACFYVSAFSGQTEGSPSSSFCASPQNAAAPIFRTVALVPTHEFLFWGYHRELTDESYCSYNNQTHPGTGFPEGTGVWSSPRNPPVPTDWGIVASTAFWDGGSWPFPCDEFFTQVLRVGVTFQMPSDVATLQSATFQANLIAYQNTDIPGYGPGYWDAYYAYCQGAGAGTSSCPANWGYFTPPCVTSVYWMKTGIQQGPSDLSLQTYESFPNAQPPLANSFAGDLEGAAQGRGSWEYNFWLYQQPPNPIATFQWPPTGNQQYAADVTSAVKQYNGAGFEIQTIDDELGTPNGASYAHQGKPLCAYEFGTIRLLLQYIARS